MTEARVVAVLITDDVLTGQWHEHSDAELFQIKDSTSAILADDAGSFMLVIDENTTVFVASRRINFIRLETR